MSRRQIWFIISLVVVFGCAALLMITYFSFKAGGMGIAAPGSQIAIVELNGTIFDSRSIVRQFKMYRKEKSIRAIVFHINSAGGDVVASQEIYEEVKKTSKGGKVVIASMSSIAASGGYFVALGASKIMANPGTTTGSIGVIANIPNVHRLLDKIGIDFNVIKSGKFKDTGSPYREMSTADRAYLQSWVNDAHDQFISAVAEGRQMDRSAVLQIADGRVFTGQQAFALGLIDTLGTFEDAIRLAADIVGIKGEPRLVRERKQRITFFDLLFQDISHVIGIVQSWPELKYQILL